MKKLLAIFALLSLAMFVHAAACSGVTSSVCQAVNNLCKGIQTLIPVASMLMLVIAAVIYAAGQMMGAETRARANVWATAALVGAVIAILIVVIAPPVLGMIFNNNTGSIICTS